MKYDTDILLRDGAPAHIRFIRMSDKDEILRIFGELNSASLNFRFFQQAKLPNEKQLAAFFKHDLEKHVAAVVVLKGKVGDVLGGVGCYRCDKNNAEGALHLAEISLAVAQAHHGRGIGTAIMELLAQVGRDNGIQKFKAEVLGEENHVLRMASHTGLSVMQSTDEGTVHISLSTKNTEEFIEQSLGRRIHAAAKSVSQVMEPTSIAVVGASRDQNSIGGGLLSNIINFGFKGDIYPVNPKADEIQGLKTYPSVAAIGKPVQIAIIVVPGRFVRQVVEECAQVGVKAVVVISAGFAEVSDTGRRQEEELTEFVRNSGMRMVGPNCMGIFNTDPSIMMNATFAPGVPRNGNVGFLSQSGALGVAILDYARLLNIGLSTFISVGNKPDVSGNDLLCYWAEDPNTEVIALYLESFGNPRKFAQIAPRIAQQKPIVAVKSGRTAAGSRAAQSHS
ncbi:GNAT family N-acetyltransferase, partial [Oligoflexia bacterium]|nr:GNAT family N-acetyltransferase [Oligoflexia bacterium]